MWVPEKPFEVKVRTTAVLCCAVLGDCSGLSAGEPGLADIFGRRGLPPGMQLWGSGDTLSPAACLQAACVALLCAAFKEPASATWQVCQ